MALRGVGRESEAESVRFHGRRVTKVGPEVKQGSSQNLFQIVAKLAGVEGFFSESWRSVGVARKSVTLYARRSPMLKTVLSASTSAI